ncbi:CLAVATA3/ESR (CLE)-related protein 46 isoform X2 [Mercurialis annua]|uniref:CLAVATA3/ESR (CLE)-related protein 46 isoform X2 n=1 Tax=Mercurialis annua TaxID=3986 RepID=UPI00215F8F3D|nr:CLAVATA3/ESR (CLE)-related protein 46 isoform X2 [Mercurialis annua]
MIIKQVLHKNASHVKFLIRLIINRLMQKMSRKTLTRLLLVWLLLVASLQYFSFHIKVQATESAHFKLEAAQPSSRSRKANIWPSRVGGRKIQKAPSGPNPVGNRNPPTKP